jgi:hypothetical protein
VEKMTSLLPEDLGEFLREIGFDFDEKLKLKNRFLKITDFLLTSSTSTSYRVKDNDGLFFEEWLEKVE